MSVTVTYSIPYKACVTARRCTAPSHLSTPGSRFCIDFYLPQGTSILAARPGVVVEVEGRYNKSYNNKSFMNRCNYIIILHADGHESVYAHLSRHSIMVKKGDKVKRGQPIGLSGQTGYATYPHLHFGVYVSDESIRPTFNKPLPPKVSWKKYS